MQLFFSYGHIVGKIVFIDMYGDLPVNNTRFFMKYGYGRQAGRLTETLNANLLADMIYTFGHHIGLGSWVFRT